MSNHKRITGDSLALVPTITNDINLVIADPPYDDIATINEAISVCRDICTGATFVFMYAETIWNLGYQPDQVLFWCKPPSTKNTVKRYSRFVEVIAAYDLDQSPFNQDTYWHTRSGVFDDTQLRTTLHPHTKPVSLMEKLILVNSLPGDMVLDPFAGSHTVERACKRHQRDSISIEVRQ